MSFSEFGLFDAQKVLNNVCDALKTNGLFLLDCDSIFRLTQYLQSHPKCPYYFDCAQMKLREKNIKTNGVSYYTLPEVAALLEKSGFKIISTFGGYNKESFTIKSKRMIVLAKKFDKTESRKIS